MGINYLYLLWALIYESVFVVMLPIHLVELIFPGRKEELWIGKKGLALIISLFMLGSFLAWFTWTQIARLNVFHLPAYHPPVLTILTGVIVIAALIFEAIRLAGNSSTENARSITPPPLWLLFIAGAVWATLLFGLVLIAFDISPAFPPEIAVAGGILLAAAALFLVPRWYADTRWNRLHEYSLIFGTMAGSMLVSFTGFIGSLSMDLYFKILVDLIAFILLIRLGRRLRRSDRLSDAIPNNRRTIS
jgi:hypothetical protein